MRGCRWASTRTRDDEGVAAVPGGGLDPGERVEEGGGAAVAGVLRVDALDVCVALLLKETHEGGLHGLGLVHDCLGANLEAANRLVRDLVLLHERVHRREAGRVDVLPLCADGHAALPEADCVLS